MDRSPIISRLLGIITAVQAHPGLSRRELVRRFEVSERTIYRDVTSLNMAGVPLIFYRGGYRIDREYFLPPIRLNFGELSALFLAGRRLASRGESMFHKELQLALDKIKAGLDNRTAAILSRLEENTCVNVTPPLKDEMSTEDFSKLNEAIQEGKTLRLSYYIPSLRRTQLRIVDPYGTLCRFGVWQFIGRYHKTNQIRAFLFKHIEKMTPAGARFEPPPDFSPGKYSHQVLDKAEKYLHKGIDLSNNDQYERAVSVYKKAIKLNPSSGTAHFMLGLSHFDQSKYKEAEEELREALKNEADDASSVHYNLAGCLLNLRKRREAISECKKAIKIEPRAADYHTLLAGIYASDIGKYEEAVNEYKKAIKIDPEDTEARLKLGLCYEKMGRKQEAKECFQKVLELSPDSEKVETAKEYLARTHHRFRSPVTL